MLVYLYGSFVIILRHVFQICDLITDTPYGQNHVLWKYINNIYSENLTLKYKGVHNKGSKTSVISILFFHIFTKLNMQLERLHIPFLLCVYNHN
jgi:hypothetical protein